MAYKHLAFSNLLLSMIFMAAVLQPVDGQIISTPCTGPMITSFTPCVNFLTNSSSNGTSPTEDCCSALRTMMTNGTNCLCLIVTGGIPFQMPMNPNLAMSLPQACNMPGVPLQCKGTFSFFGTKIFKELLSPFPIYVVPSLLKNVFSQR